MRYQGYGHNDHASLQVEDESMFPMEREGIASRGLSGQPSSSYFLSRKAWEEAPETVLAWDLFFIRAGAILGTELSVFLSFPGPDNRRNFGWVNG